MSEEKYHIDQTTESEVNWTEIHDRLREIREGLEKTYEVTDREKKRILKDRAAALAMEGEKALYEVNPMEVVEFVLASERYCIESRYINEIVSLENLTLLPCTPAYIKGVTNLRGQIVSVIDIRTFFDLPGKSTDADEKVVFLHSDETEFGIIADEIVGVRTIGENEIQSSLPTLTDIREKFLKGVTVDRAVILDAGKLLTDSTLVLHEEV